MLLRSQICLFFSNYNRIYHKSSFKLLHLSLHRYFSSSPPLSLSTSPKILMVLCSTTFALGLLMDGPIASLIISFSRSSVQPSFPIYLPLHPSPFSLGLWVCLFILQHPPHYQPSYPRTIPLLLWDEIGFFLIVFNIYIRPYMSLFFLNYMILSSMSLFTTSLLTWLLLLVLSLWLCLKLDDNYDGVLFILLKIYCRHGWSFLLTGVVIFSLLCLTSIFLYIHSCLL